MTREELRRKLAANPRFRFVEPSGRGTVIGGVSNELHAPRAKPDVWLYLARVAAEGRNILVPERPRLRGRCGRP